MRQHLLFLAFAAAVYSGCQCSDPPGVNLRWNSSLTRHPPTAAPTRFRACWLIKGAMISLVKSLAIELAPRQVTVNAVAPGWVDTEMVAGALAGDVMARVASSIPLGRVASPRDIAGPIVFLCSDLARHVTGEILTVNGGSVLCG